MTQQLAQGLAALGRGPDSMLVHMAPSEVHGLQKLAMAHGGSLTINPDTGLPEAGFLSSILPMVIGAGLMASGIGAPMAGMLVGGGTAVATGSLSKGLMAGLGAYGGAGLTEGLMGAGANSLSAGVGAAAEVPIGAVVPQAVAPTAAQTAVQAATPNILGGTASELAGAYGYPAAPAVSPINATQIAPTITQAPVIPPAPTGPVPTMSPTGDFARFDRALSPGLGAGPMDQISAGFQSATASPGAAFNFAKANAYPLGAVGITALSAMQPEPLGALEKNPGMIRPYTFSREKNPSAFIDTPGDSRSSRERRYFDDRYIAGTPYKAPGPEYMAEGGSVGGYSYDPATGQYSGGQASLPSMGGAPVSDYASGNIGGYTYDPITQQYTLSSVTPEGQARRDAAAVAQEPASYGGESGGNWAAGGGISDLGGYSDGGRLLRGPGDGVSDNIPAVIGKKQPARLADGEFVVPARIVSELGNGSTEAGARQLYSMMDRVQKNRQKSIGKGKVATDSRSHKLLPA